MSPTCRSCGAPLVWARTARGKLMPLDRAATSAGNVATRVEREQQGGQVVEVLHADVLGPLEVALLDQPARDRLMMPHHATCPDAGRWRS